MPRIPLLIGNAISVGMLVLAVEIAKHVYALPEIPKIIILIVCWFVMLYFSHCLSHYIIGRLLGIKFRYYFLSSSMLSKAGIPIISRIFSVKAFLTLKIAEKSKGWRFFAMFVAGPIASMISPLVIVAIAYSYDRFASAILLILTIGNAIFTGYFSYKHGCIRKGINALRK